MRKSANRAVVRPLAVLIGMSILLVACGGGEDDGSATEEATDTPSATDQVVTVWQFGSPQPEREYYLDRLAEFEDETGIRVENEMFDWDDRHQQVSLAHGGDNLPDVLVIENSMLAELSNEEVIVPVTDLTADAPDRVDAWAEHYVPSLWELGSYEGEFYGFSPYADLSPNLIYNTEMLAEAGIEPPQTWSELLEAAAALTTDDRYGIAFGSTATLDTDIFESIAYMNGARWLDPESGEPTLSDAGWVDAMAFVEELSVHAQPGITDQNFRDALQLFYAEQAAMVISKSFAPIIAQDYDVSPDFPDAMASFPRPDSPSGAFEPVDSVGQAALLFVPTRSVQDAEAVMDFLEFWAQPEQHVGWDGSEIMGRVPTAWDVIRSDTWAEQYPALAAELDVAFESVEPLPVFPGHSPAQEQLTQAIQGVLIGSVTPEEALDSVEAELR